MEQEKYGSGNLNLTEKVATHFCCTKKNSFSKSFLKGDETDSVTFKGVNFKVYCNLQ